MTRKHVQKNKTCPQCLQHNCGRRGFVMLFAVILSSVILVIALGVNNIALKEITFGTNAIATNDAFFAADTGAECVLYNDKTTTNKFPLAGPATSIICANTNITPTFSGNGTTANYSFTLTGLGSTSNACVKVTVFKDNSTPPMKTNIVAKGYNTGNSSCNSTSTSRVERELHVDY